MKKGIVMLLFSIILLSACGNDPQGNGVPEETADRQETGVQQSESGTDTEIPAGGETEAEESAGEETEADESAGGQSAQDGESATEEPSKPAVSDTPKTYRVEIVNFAYAPQEIEIETGSTIEFVNLDDVKHTATGDNGEFDTGLLGKGESKTIAFDEAGEYGYYCIPHPGMRGAIIVK